MINPRQKWQRKIRQEIGKAFKDSHWYLSPCECSHHTSYKLGYQQALKDLGMFMGDDL